MSKYILACTEALGFITMTWEHHMQFFRLTINRELNISFKIKQCSSNAFIPLSICPRCDMNTTILCFWRQAFKPYLAPGWASCEVPHKLDCKREQSKETKQYSPRDSEVHSFALGKVSSLRFWKTWKPEHVLISHIHNNLLIYIFLK